MPRFLTALIALSILVMAQNVVAVTPAPSSACLESEMLESSSISTPDLAAIGGTPQPSTVALLLIGISGLAAAGNRTPREEETSGS